MSDIEPPANPAPEPAKAPQAQVSPQAEPKPEPKSPRAKALQAALSAGDSRVQEARSRKLVTLIAIGLTLLMCVLLVRIFQLQAKPSAEIAKLNEQSTLKHELVAFRGAIVDRRGRVLAASQLRYRLFMDPQMVLDNAAAAIEKKWPSAEELLKKGAAAIPADAPPGDAEALREILASNQSKKERLRSLQEALKGRKTLDGEDDSSGIIDALSQQLFEKNWRELPTRLGQALHYGPAEIARISKAMQDKQDKSYIVLDTLLSPERLDAFRQLAQSKNKDDRLPGLGLEPCSFRSYPLGETAGQLIGFTGKEEVLADGRRVEKGQEGLERLWNTRLQATNGVAESVVDKHRRPVWISADGYQLPKDGENVQLSIDARIQEVAEKQLAITCTKANAQSGIMIVMQPHTGEILAMANWPPFDPSRAGQYSNAERQKLERNRAVADIFEPGSIFKPMVWGSLVDDGYMNPAERVDTTAAGVWHMPNGRNLHDADAAKGHGHGVVSWEEVLAVSSNIGMAKGAAKTSQEWMHDTLAKWGFGAPTGSGLPGDAYGILNSVRKWDKYTMSSLPMGQSVGVTTLQIMRAYSAIANGGLLLTPTVEVMDGHPADPLKARRVISEKGAAATRQAMRLVMTNEHGTGRMAVSKYYDIFGKTGTAQLPNEGRKGYSDFYISSFVGGAPLDHPRLIVGCFVRKTKKGRHFGGVVAAPFVANTLEASLVYLGVPTNPGTDPSKMYQEWDVRGKKLADEVNLGWPGEREND